MEASMTTTDRTILVGLLLGGLIALVCGVVADSAEAVTVTVTTKDDGAGVCPSKPLAPVLSRTPCTLRTAIAEVNAQPAGAGPHRINFAIGYGNQSINVLAYLGPLPAITRPVFIDGQSQQRYTKPCLPLILEPGCSSGTLTPCYAPCIAVNGMFAGSPVDGLTLGSGSDGSTIRNLLITNFLNGAGIRVHSTSVFIQGNYIGTDATGAFAQPSAYKMDTGVYLDKSSFNATVNAGNVISGNVNGIIIDATGLTDSLSSIAKRTGHDVLGNRIGTNAAGTAIIGNGMYGVYIKNASANVVGGGNLIGGNFYGVSIASSNSFYPTVENRVESNFIGTDASGTIDLNNAHDGVNLGGALTGGSVKSTNVQGNVVKYNLACGIKIVSNSKSNTVQYNTAVQDNVDLTDENTDVPCANTWANNVFETHYDAAEPSAHCIY
jgi:hypothetical protein